MRLALVTTPWDARSRVGDATRALVRHLADSVQIDVYVEAGREGADWFGRTTRSASALLPREYDQVLYALGNEPQHAFMARMLRTLGGSVALHDWALCDLASAAYPHLTRGGWRGVALALREGGPGEARRYFQAWRSSVGTPLAPHDLHQRGLTLNRSIVRFGDAFLVPDERIAHVLLDDRNAPTPIGVVAYPSDERRSDPDAWSSVAARYAELLQRFPPPRSARKRLLWMRVTEELRGQRPAH